LGEGKQLFWLLSPEHSIMITQTIFAEYNWTWLHVHCTLSTLHGNLISDHWYPIILALSSNCTACILPPQIICAYTCYCRPYLYGPLSSFFPLTGLLPIQDMSSTPQTHLGAAHIHFGCCYYARFGQFNGHLIMHVLGLSWTRCQLNAQNVHKMGSKCVWAASILFWNKMDLAWGRNGKKSNNNYVHIQCRELP
jgi:hypothetical protein